MIEDGSQDLTSRSHRRRRYHRLPPRFEFRWKDNKLIEKHTGLQVPSFGYSRVIGPVDEAYIRYYYEAFGGPEPPPIDHLGIDEAFEGKASWVHYWYEGSWVTLQGAD